MRTPRSLLSLTPRELVSETRALLAARAENTAGLLEHLAEIDSRRMYVEAAYPSMQAFCVGELGMAADSAAKRVQAARAAQRVPALLPAVADNRLHLTAVLLIAPILTPGNADEVIDAAAHRSCAEIRELLAERERRAQPIGDLLTQSVANPRCEQDSNPVMSGPRHATSAPHFIAPAPSPQAPPAPERRILQFTVPAELADAYRDALALAPYEVAHDPAMAFAHMLAAWREKLEKRRCGVGARRTARRGCTDGRHVPAEVRAQVWQRDGGCCTFVSDAGRRCECRDQLELDHVTPVARGGRSTVDNVRLRCRAHNQLEAERAFGKGYMQAKREAARAARDEARARRVAQRAEHERARAMEASRRAAAEEVAPYLRRLGVGANEAMHLALRASPTPGLPLEQRVLAAVRMLGPRGSRTTGPEAGGSP